ncbi:ABC transporter permease [Streptomyces sp. WAC 06738]|uniref:ABC transporter permease n=1 Tax=Streptomyces sp. WAC 06738 TaxID=2203210 RepID=UPI000F6F0F56|nr:ABC transporter permease [Streptomyces sp. WAC 06738]AZM49280.1 ABC transporter permease [Streptomyces sp. WAC 06738]
MTLPETTPVRPPAAPDEQSRTPKHPVRRLAGPALSVAVIALALFLWWLFTTATDAIDPLKFPAPDKVWDSASNLRETLWSDATATLGRVVVSWSVGSALGVAVGLLMSRSRALFYALTPVIEAVRPIPPVALIPFVILWFGIGDSGKIFLGALASFMVMVVNTIVAAGNVNPLYGRAARSLGAGSGQVYRTVVLRAIVPELLSGLRIGSALTFAVVVAAEFQGAQSGLGRLIMQASRTLNTPSVLVGTIIIAIEAVLLDRIIKLLSDRATRWSASAP